MLVSKDALMSIFVATDCHECKTPTGCSARLKLMQSWLPVGLNNGLDRDRNAGVEPRKQPLSNNFISSEDDASQSSLVVDDENEVKRSEDTSESKRPSNSDTIHQRHVTGVTWPARDRRRATTHFRNEKCRPDAIVGAWPGRQVVRQSSGEVTNIRWLMKTGEWTSRASSSYTACWLQ